VTITDDVLAALGAHDLEFAEPPTPLDRGHSAVMYRFRIVDPPPDFDGVLVFRRSAAARREAAAQATAHEAGYPTPPILAFGDDFTIMPFVDARTPMAAAGARGIPKLFRALPGLLASTMARLHALGLLCDVPDGTDELLAAIDGARVLEWLERHRPAPPQRLLCHGDLHGENLLSTKDGLVAVLDWELAALGPPELDVARTRLILATLPGVGGAARAALRIPAGKASAAFTEVYAARRPLRPEVLRWYDAAWAARQITVGTGIGSVAAMWRPLRGHLHKRLELLMAQ
jgi:hypothetical protein